MLLTYKRTDLIERLEAKRKSMDKDADTLSERLRKAAIAQVKAEIARLEEKLNRVKDGTLGSDECVYTDLGTYGPRGRRNNNDAAMLDAVISQLKLATDEKIKLGERTGTDILRFLS